MCKAWWDNSRKRGMEVMAMLQVIPILKTLLVAAAGGYVGYKLRIPSGAMIGAMVAVAAVSLTKADLGRLPDISKPAVQVILGAILGFGLRNITLSQLKSLFIPAALMIAVLLAAGFLVALILHRYFGFDVMTALFSSTPGGMTELSAVASEMKADASVVAILQLLRLVSVLMLIGPLAKLLSRQ